MNTKIPLAQFDVAERVPIEVIHRQSAVIAENPLTTELLNSVLNYVFILNQHRQIVFMSRNCEDLVPGRPLDSLLGLRPGEALGCQQVESSHQSCGTTVFCAECGAAKGIVAALMGQKSVQECHLTRIINCQPEAMDLLVYTIPFEYKGERFAIVSVADISHEKRRRALERIFFHDLINTAGGISGVVELLQGEVLPGHQMELGILQRGMRELLDEIQAQRDLSLAESGDLVLRVARVDSLDLLQSQVRLYQRHPLAEGRQIQVDPRAVAVALESDGSLLKRVLGNFLKNALEAAKAGQTITAGCVVEGAQARFLVHNPGVMPPEAQLQIFQRSFTTKGSGRGLGTYSARLLTEKYLRGKVGFSSKAEEGTVFWFQVPVAVGARPSPPPAPQPRL